MQDTVLHFERRFGKSGTEDFASDDSEELNLIMINSAMGSDIVCLVTGSQSYAVLGLSSKQNSSANQEVFQGQQANSLQQRLLTRFLIRNVKLEMVHLYDNIRGASSVPDVKTNRLERELPTAACQPQEHFALTALLGVNSWF
ncbi:hypothetical protein MJT46_009739 [Ovis ammon polii x Ovis aries]|nr:hypothetical protein MJT46_009739 [Ovis ammon polii x Ovis aries]